MRYELDRSKTITRFGVTLFNVTDDSKPTEAYSVDTIKFSDTCEVTGGEFHGGVFRGGEFRDGEFHGGVFRGGVFHGGVFHGGVFHGGVFRGGWLPLQIQGSKHYVNIPDGKNIKIGCQCHGADYWVKNYERIGKIEGYSESEIKEYKLYIDLAVKMIEEL